MHDQVVTPAALAAEEDSSRLGPVGAAVTVALAALGLVAAWARLREAEVEVGGARAAVLLAAAGVLVTLGVARLRAGHLRAAGVGCALLAAAGVLIGLPDLPPWPSAATFGQSPWFFVVAAGAAGLAVAATASRPRPDAALVVFLVLATAGGAMFARRADAFLPLLGFVAAVGLLPSRGGGLAWGRAPFLTAFGLLLAWLLVPTFVAVDVDRHLTGWSRVAIAAFPLVVLGAGAPRPERAWSAVVVVLGTALAAAICGGLTIAEAAGAFDLRHALGARLSIFGIHPNLGAPFFALALPLAAALMVGGGGASRRLLGLASFGASASVLVLTRSRAAIVAGALAVVVFVGVLVAFRVWRARPRGSTIALVLAAVVLGGAGVALVGHEKIVAKLSDSSMAFRVYLWGVAADAIEERPVLGYGLLSGEPLAVNATPSDLDGRSKNIHPHNVLFALALGAGTPAAALYLLLLGLLVVRLIATLARLDGRGRALAAGTIAAAVGLFVANLLDLGLSNHAPIALHLGLLLGVGALLIRSARDEEPPLPGRIPIAATGFGLLAVLALGWSVLALVGEAGAATVRRALARGEVAAADRWTAALVRMNPFHLQLGMLRVQALRRAARTAAERDALRELVQRHPLSPVPWEALSALELGRNRLLAALEALTAARRLDRTGPLASEWALRQSRILLRLGRLEAALDVLAEALRFDTQAARRVEWARGADGDWVTVAPDVEGEIALLDVLDRNRARLPALVESEPVLARRAAAALAFTYRDFDMIDETLAVIDEYEALGGVPFVPLQFLRTQLQEQFEETEETDDQRADESGEFRVAGDAAARLAEGRKLVALERYDEALVRFEAGLAGVHDLAAERENFGYLAEEIVWVHLARGAPDAARAALPRALYAYGDAAVRAERIGQVADGYLDAGDTATATAVLSGVEAVVPYLRPNQDQAAVDALATRLGRLDPAAARALVERLSTSGAGLTLATRVLRARGERDAARLSRERLRNAFPAWAR